MKKRNILLLVIAMSVATILQASESGTCGRNVKWALNSSTGKLVISGTGAMSDYNLPNGYPSPWEKASVKTLVVEEGVTEIGTYAFYYCVNLTKVSLPNSLTRIGAFSFTGCDALKEIEIPVAVKTIEHSAFCYCRNIQDIHILSNKVDIAAFAFGYCDKVTAVSFPNSKSKYSHTSFPAGTKIGALSSESDYAFSYRSNRSNSQQQVNSSSSAPSKKRNLEDGPFSIYAKDYVEKGIKEWQQKGEFEKTSDWQARVNEQNRQKKVDELVAQAEEAYIAYHKKSIKLNPTLGKYDADNEVFAMSDAQFGTTYMAVPLDKAQSFKENWNNKELSYQLQINDDDIKLASVSIVMPDGAEYTYRNTDAVTYNLADIEYNFAPIELNLASSSDAPKGQVNVTKTKIKVGVSEVDTEIPETKPTNTNTYAIIFANEDYKNVAPVPFAKNDGAIFQKYCQKTLGIPSNNIHYVENASFNDMRIQLAWLNDVCDAFEGNVSLIIYYAGHGIPDEASKSAYLLPVDGDGRYVQSAYKLDDMYQKLGAMKAKTVTVFMDACFSGSKREEGMLASARGVAIKVDKGQPTGNMVVFSAATGDQTAYPNNQEGHGMFTYYLLKKLQETKGDVTYEELGNYIKQNVSQQSIVINGKSQTPTIIASPAVTDWQSWKLK